MIFYLAYSLFGIKCQNLSAYLENKVHWKSKLSKYGIMVFFNEIFFVKIRLIFDIEKWLWKSEFRSFWPSIPNQAKYLEPFYCRFHRPLALVEYCSSGEDVSVNTVIILRNWAAILADLWSEATEEAHIAPQFWGLMTVLTDISDPELLYSHCYHANFCAKYWFFNSNTCPRSITYCDFSILVHVLYSILWFFNFSACSL